MAVSFVKSSKSFVTEFMETGNIGLDMAVSNGKGLPVGGCVILYAEQGAGKSTIFADALRRLLTKYHNANLPFKAVYIDIERSDTLFRGVGLDKFVDDEYGNRLLYKPGHCSFEELEEICNGILKGDETYADVKLIVIDSIGYVECAQEANKDLSTGDFGTAARTRNAFYKKYVSRLKDKGVSFLFIAQGRQNQEAGMFGDPLKAALAKGDLHIADVILKVSKSEGGSNAETKKQDIQVATSEKAEKLSANFKVKFTKTKNRYANLPSVEILCTYGRGVQNYYILKIMLEKYKFIKNKGSAQRPKWVIDEELANAVGDWEQESDTVTLKKWLSGHVNPIRDFLKANDLYRVLPDDAAEAVDE